MIKKQNIQSIDIILDEEPPNEIKAILQRGLRDYNHPFLGTYELKRFAVYIKNQTSEVIAGIYGFTIAKHKTLRLEFVWVHEDYRGLGLGAQLLSYIDKYAVSKGCCFIQVSTFEFQGKGFYKKMGYQEIGTIPKWFCDKDEIFFLKKLAFWDPARIGV
ncbi:GNAT family N-acetyltransferase [Candidatus Odyssella acanthamoebae]|uniref:N-acetyltransferase domain-containing protein n=1 Tax=Candidatus Odyssella acanthamoebae TaxID=91604 RepID=A0A077B112_9PROT|nr:GNAT family N-acetyltransferase [Candidatus Paracaedibacter acanthamoebae]AIK96635.1 hypothetical protein ID47_07745 [Candidatus Paracaedibacter acanthamoebae]